ncbi:conserved hypothetical protein [uncultured Gammaproteobacteria bacterium]
MSLRSRSGVIPSAAQAAAAATQRHEVVIEMLKALDRQAREADRLGRLAAVEARRDNYAVFMEFRRKVDEARTLVVVLYEHISVFRGAAAEPLREELERLELSLLSLTLRAGKQFFSILASGRALPLGSRDLFEPELEVLHQTRERLRTCFEGRTIGPDLLPDLAELQSLIERVLTRSTSLPNFDEE